MLPFSQPPKTSASPPSPFEVSISPEQIQWLKLRLSDSRIAKSSWENSQDTGRFGVSRDWLVDAVTAWKDKFDWTKQERAINSIPNFKIAVDDDGEQYEMHFMALFSQKADATPILFLHGWPGSFLEFLPILSKVRDQYASQPTSLPYHLIVPSLPGYAFSNLSARKNFKSNDAIRILNKLMINLGFGDGYIVQGGDVGSELAKKMAMQFDEVKGAHINMFFMMGPEGDASPPTAAEQEALKRSGSFAATGMGYAIIQGTRPSTISFAVASSPVGLLAWIGEKMLAWTDTKPALDDILANVSLYWFTDCLPTSIWMYKERLGDEAEPYSSSLEAIKKPFGYSWFPYDVTTCPKSWAESSGKVSFYRAHDKGGHFAALEQPDLLWQDVVEFVQHVKDTAKP